MAYAQRGDRPYPIAIQNRDLLHTWTAMRCMALGTADGFAWSDLRDTVMMVVALCRMGKLNAHAVLPFAMQALEGLLRAKSNGMRMAEEDLPALSVVCTQYDNAHFKLSANTLEAAAASVRASVEAVQAQAREETAVPA